MFFKTLLYYCDKYCGYSISIAHSKFDPPYRVLKLVHYKPKQFTCAIKWVMKIIFAREKNVLRRYLSHPKNPFPIIVTYSSSGIVILIWFALTCIGYKDQDASKVKRNALPLTIFAFTCIIQWYWQCLASQTLWPYS